MSINLVQLTQSVMTDGVMRQLAERLGLPSDSVGKVLSATGPAIVAGLMQKGATLEGARSLFTAIMSPEVDTHVGEQLTHLLGSTNGLSQLEATGRRLLEQVLERRTDVLSDEVSLQTGVPAHAAYAVTGVVGATMLGLLKKHFLQQGGGVGQLPTLLGHQLPAIAPHLNDRLLGTLGLGGLAAFSANTLAQLKAVSAHIEHPTPSAKPAADVPPAYHVPADAVVRPERRSHKWLLWLLALAALVLAAWALLFLRGCEGGQSNDPADLRTTSGAGQVQAASEPALAASTVAPEPAASDTASASASASAASGASAPLPASSASQAAVVADKDSQFSFVVNAAGMPTITATVGSEAEKAQLLDQLTNRLGESNYVANITVDPHAKPADWLSHLNDLLPLMSLPGAEMKITGTHVELSGSAANGKLGWLDKLKSLFGASYQIGSFDVEHAVAEATNNFRGAIKSLLSPDSTCVAAEVVKVLNLQVINFASGSNNLPVSALDDLKQSGKVLSACARNGKTARLEVAGYSDNVGGAQANLQLSKRRAQAVRDYLVQTGVPASSLTAQGYGDTHPIASNDTASGRFANRRIEFLTQQ
ncbi:OmpA family protein [Paraburkholderia sp. PREW-6R]|uniref:OmpA family protein n=1 Tax=Paraburkholderia sp. PREW-6R TaxID=3141544 RepID=UPI0031F5C652